MQKQKISSRNQKKQKKHSPILLWACLIVVTPISIYITQRTVDNLLHSSTTNIITTSTYSEKAIQNSEYRTNYRNDSNGLIFKSSLRAVTGTTNVKSRTNSVAVENINKLKIAYAITITKDGFFQDGAAVLAYSIISSSDPMKFDISLIAFVHPNVTIARPFLTRLGYTVIEAPTPLNTSAIRGNKFLREKIDKNGCCGATELIKLYSYRLLDFDRVVHLDADTIIINPIDELFATNHSLIYTTDPNMATFKGELGMPVQGGFLVLRPSLEDYKSIINIVMTVPFRNGGGWNGSHVGWYWGGMTIQGVLAYYYYLVSPGRCLKLDRCIYNTMADTVPCSKQSLNEIKSAHFTVCQKPWSCDTWRGDYHEPLCSKLQDRWFELRKKAEAYYGLTPVINACPKRGKQHYVSMDLMNARVPPDSGIASFKAPDRLNPLPGSGFVDIDGHDFFILVK